MSKTEQNPEREETARRVYSNIRHLAKTQSLRIWDVEIAGNVARGYYARCNEANIIPGINPLIAASALFGITIDELLNEDLPLKAKKGKEKKALKATLTRTAELLSKDEMIQVIKEL